MEERASETRGSSTRSTMEVWVLKGILITRVFFIFGHIRWFFKLEHAKVWQKMKNNLVPTCLKPIFWLNPDTTRNWGFGYPFHHYTIMSTVCVCTLHIQRAKWHSKIHSRHVFFQHHKQAELLSMKLEFVKNNNFEIVRRILKFVTKIPLLFENYNIQK